MTVVGVFVLVGCESAEPGLDPAWVVPAVDVAAQVVITLADLGRDIRGGALRRGLSAQLLGQPVPPHGHGGFPCLIVLDHPPAVGAAGFPLLLGVLTGARRECVPARPVADLHAAG